ncbi:MAG: hypothetical protein H5T97_09180 [Firmicutes bacterium]|nr:hypothetical protein [Bacillota bacterium]
MSVAGCKEMLREIVDTLADILAPPAECANLAPPPGSTEWQGECDGRSFRFLARRLCEGREDVCPREAETLAVLVADVERFYRDLLKDPEYVGFICDQRASREDPGYCDVLRRRGPDSLHQENCAVSVRALPGGV